MTKTKMAVKGRVRQELEANAEKYAALRSRIHELSTKAVELEEMMVRGVMRIDSKDPKAKFSTKNGAVYVGYERPLQISKPKLLLLRKKFPFSKFPQFWAFSWKKPIKAESITEKKAGATRGHTPQVKYFPGG